jgi:cyclic pyranopterin phosphate synthase
MDCMWAALFISPSGAVAHECATLHALWKERIMSGKLTHFDDAGRARMVDVGAKPATRRVARATGQVRMSPQALELALAKGGKGDVRAVAEIAGVMAAKKTSELIPMCHPLLLSTVRVTVDTAPDGGGLTVTSEVAVEGPTGVEMEALTGVSVACLTIYDMLKAVDRSMRIDGVRLLEKSGGASGRFLANDQPEDAGPQGRSP